MGLYLEVLEEPPGQAWSISDVRSAPLATRFVPSHDHVLAYGYQASAYWLRLTVDWSRTTEPEWRLEVANKSLDHVTLYRPGPTGDLRIHRTGDALPFGQRPVRHRNFVFPLPRGGEETQTIHLRVASQGPMIVPVHLWPEPQFWQKDRKAQFVLGLFFGLLLIMVVYNFFLSTAMSDASYLYYVLYILGYIAYQITVERIAFEYLWPDNLWWAERASSTLALVCAIWGIQFSRRFLDTARLVPRLDGGLRLLMLTCILLIGLNVGFGGHLILHRVTALFFVVVASALGVAACGCWLRGSPPARYYLIAWGFVLTGTIVTMLTYLGVLPYTFWTLRGVQIGSVMEVTLLSLSLRDRYLALRTESDRVRLRIAGDLHDDIGSGLTQISLYSELAGRASGREAQEWMGKVGALARDLVDRMQDIVWAIKPDEGAWESLELRMKDYAASLLAPTDLAFRMEGEEVHEGVELSPDERQHVLLLFKEALHNAVRHSEGTSVQVQWRLTRRELRLRICDDGRGFRASAPRCGHGLGGMERRVRELGGTMTLTTAPGDGTCLDFEVPLRPTATHRPMPRGWRSPEARPMRGGPWTPSMADEKGAKTPRMRGAARADSAYPE